MLFDLFTAGGNFTEALISLLLTIPIILIALTFHEVAHGWVSYKQGDPTAYNLGRLSLNPMKHLDPVGTLAMLLFGVGWAKPVPVNSRYYKNPKWGMALTALAGPVMNLILAFIGVILYQLTWRITANMAADALLVSIILAFFFNFACLNAYLAIFNLLPIPPFDGSRIAFIFLPDRLYFSVMRYEKIIMIVVLLLIMTGALSGLLSNIVYAVLNGMFKLVGMVI